MARKSGLAVEQAILRALLSGERSMRELETVVNTNYATIRAHCNVLAFYGMIEISAHEKSEANGRPYTTARITDAGRAVLAKKSVTLRR